MTLKVVAQSPPLETNADGVVLVGETRVTLDTVVAALSIPDLFQDRRIPPQTPIR